MNELREIGIIRCINCDTWNDADQYKCKKCFKPLYHNFLRRE